MPSDFIGILGSLGKTTPKRHNLNGSLRLDLNESTPPSSMPPVQHSNSSDARGLKTSKSWYTPRNNGGSRPLSETQRLREVFPFKTYKASGDRHAPRKDDYDQWRTQNVASGDDQDHEHLRSRVERWRRQADAADTASVPHSETLEKQHMRRGEELDRTPLTSTLSAQKDYRERDAQLFSNNSDPKTTPPRDSGVSNSKTATRFYGPLPTDKKYNVHILP